MLDIIVNDRFRICGNYYVNGTPTRYDLHDTYHRRTYSFTTLADAQHKARSIGTDDKGNISTGIL